MLFKNLSVYPPPAIAERNLSPFWIAKTVKEISPIRWPIFWRGRSKYEHHIFAHPHLVLGN